MSNLTDELEGKIIIHDYGIEEGVQTFRINGIKKDLESLCKSLLATGVKFHQDPLVEQTYPRSMHTVLLKIVIPD